MEPIAPPLPTLHPNAVTIGRFYAAFAALDAVQVAVITSTQAAALTSAHNTISARFLFRDGLIIAHRDAFNFWAWSRQALGVSGLLLGGSAWLRAKVRAQAAAKLGLFKAGRRA